MLGQEGWDGRGVVGGALLGISFLVGIRGGGDGKVGSSSWGLSRCMDGLAERGLHSPPLSWAPKHHTHRALHIRSLQPIPESSKQLQLEEKNPLE